jgi:hypothetical protein
MIGEAVGYVEGPGVTHGIFDSFDRTDSTGWGTSDYGVTYFPADGPTTELEVSSRQGLLHTAGQNSVGTSGSVETPTFFGSTDTLRVEFDYEFTDIDVVPNPPGSPRSLFLDAEVMTGDNTGGIRIYIYHDSNATVGLELFTQGVAGDHFDTLSYFSDLGHVILTIDPSLLTADVNGNGLSLSNPSLTYFVRAAFALSQFCDFTGHLPTDPSSTTVAIRCVRIWLNGTELQSAIDPGACPGGATATLVSTLDIPEPQNAGGYVP